MATNALRQAAGQAAADKKKNEPLIAVRNQLEAMKSQMALALPKHLNPDRMARLVMTCFSTSPKLFDCTFKSVAAAVMTSAQLGLEIGVQGQAYLIPYGKTATFVPGWQGLIDICNRAGRSSVWTGAVFEGDEFEWQLGDSPFLKHRPMGESEPKKLLYAYSVGRVNGSEWPVIECWPNARLLKHRDRYNKVGTKHYSYENWEMYARKIVLLQVLKYMPKSIELTAAMELGHRNESESNVLDGNFTVIPMEDDEESTVEQSTNGSNPDSSKQKSDPSAYEFFSEKLRSGKIGVLQSQREPIEKSTELTDDQRASLLELLDERIAIINEESAQ